MAEALGLVSVAAAVLATVQIANNFYRMARQIRETDDPKVKIIQYNLMTQRQRTIAWAHRIQLEGTDNWNIPAESSQDVETILQQMEKYFQRAEDKMAKLHRAPGGKMTSRMFVERFLFNSGGFQELKDLTDALTAMNETLSIIAPPLPAYSPLGDTWGQPQNTVKIPSTPAQAVIQDVHGLATPEAKTAGNAEDSSKAHLATTISTLYSQCLDVLVLLSSIAPQDISLRNHCGRLRLWGVGIFKPTSLSLDTIFRKDRVATQTLSDVIVRALVYIAVTEERILRPLCELEQGRNGEMTRAWTTLSAMLGKDTLSDIAVERWESLLAATTEQAPNMDESWERSIPLPRDSIMAKDSPPAPTDNASKGKDTPQIDQGSTKDDYATRERGWKPELINMKKIETEVKELERIVDSSMKPEDSEKSEIPEPTGYSEWREVADLGRLIELLFELLPPIRSIRRASLLQIEPAKPEKAAVAMESSDSPQATQTTNEPDATLGLTFQQLLDHSLELAGSLETLLRNDEAWAKQNGTKVQSYAPELRDELKRLEAFNKRNVGEGNAEDMKDILGIIGNLGRALNRTISEISVSEKPGSCFHLVDKRHSDEKANQIIKEVIELFKQTNTALYQQPMMLKKKKQSVAQPKKLVAV